MIIGKPAPFQTPLSTQKIVAIFCLDDGVHLILAHTVESLSYAGRSAL